MTPTQNTILTMSARQDISFSDAELKFLDENIAEVMALSGQGLLEVNFENKHVRNIITLEKGRDLLYSTEKKAWAEQGEI